MKRIKLLGILTSAIVLFSTVGVQNISAEEVPSMRDISTMELVRNMGIGINLGNTLESSGDWIAQWGDGTVASYETAWGSPVITEEMIQGYANEGFGVIRVPVAWSNMMGDNYTINKDYIARVKEIVDWSIKNDLYVIMNIHWDGGWFSGFSTDKETCMDKYTRIWTQLCDEFQNYSDYLMFESLNEEGCWNDLWNRYAGNNGKDTAYSLLNEINQKFVDVVRSSDGNNPKRHLLIAGYATDFDLTCDPLFKMPTDTANRCAVSVHYYTPSTFCILEEDADWGKAVPTWGTAADIDQLNHYMELMKTTFIDKGIPVIIGEYGCPKKNKDADSVRNFIYTTCKTAYDNKLCPVLWDVTGLHYDRSECKMIDPELKEQLCSIVETERSLGDLNADGSVDVADAVLMQKHLFNILLLDSEQAEYADCCNDEIIDSFDLVALRKML